MLNSIKLILGKRAGEFLIQVNFEAAVKLEVPKMRFSKSSKKLTGAIKIATEDS